ncbi:MAG: efflux transporter outer membrane subunit, partial [Candidatus Binatia bacterium]
VRHRPRYKKRAVQIAGASVAALAGLFLVGLSGCIGTVGPDYTRPEAPILPAWIEARSPRVVADAPHTDRWWQIFQDPVLSKLVESAATQNLTLHAAGLRVLQAQARRAIAIGNLFPQQQAFTGSYTRTRRSVNTAAGAVGPRDVSSWQAGLDALWELDLWGKFRRAIEASDAELLASVASYDDVLVSLVAEVAATYARIRVVEERLAVARDNVRVEHDSLEIARIRFEAGGTSELDVQQATALLKDTEATIPQLGIQLRQSINSLAVLLGKPPAELRDLLGEEGRVPVVPPEVAVGIPADLLRRRPDVRRAEQEAAAQSARIGVAVGELLPSFQLTGTLGLSAEDAANFFEGRSFTGSFGPAIRWPILNYGRIINNVRLQDATFQELAVAYANTVLVAQREVEDALVAYIRGTEQLERLAESVAAAKRAVEISQVQYREGATDYTSALSTQQAKLREEDLLASTRGAVVFSAIALFKALGGGWEIRDGRDYVPDATRDVMRARTNWGTLLAPEARARDVDAAPADPGKRQSWWWPEW